MATAEERGTIYSSRSRRNLSGGVLCRREEKSRRWRLLLCCCMLLWLWWRSTARSSVRTPCLSGEWVSEWVWLDCSTPDECGQWSVYLFVVHPRWVESTLVEAERASDRIGVVGVGVENVTPPLKCHSTDRQTERRKNNDNNKRGVNVYEWEWMSDRDKFVIRWSLQSWSLWLDSSWRKKNRRIGFAAIVDDSFGQIVYWKDVTIIYVRMHMMMWFEGSTYIGVAFDCQRMVSWDSSGLKGLLINSKLWSVYIQVIRRSDLIQWISCCCCCCCHNGGRRRNQTDKNEEDIQWKVAINVEWGKQWNTGTLEDVNVPLER